MLPLTLLGDVHQGGCRNKCDPYENPARLFVITAGWRVGLSIRPSRMPDRQGKQGSLKGKGPDSHAGRRRNNNTPRRNYVELSFDTILNTYILPWGTKIVMAVLVFIIGRWIAKLLTKALQSVMTKGKVDQMLVNFLGNITYSALLAVVVLAALEKLGVNTTSALAILGAAGLAVGLALKDSLTSFAAGVMLIIFRPFKLGDFVEAGGIAGVVEEIRIFHTVLKTGDNREVTMPNAQIYSGTIVNYSARETRRIDLVIGIGYDDDIKKARDLINRVLEADATVLKDPAPTVMLLELGASSVDFAVRPWVKSGDYWTTRAAILEAIKTTFDKEGVSIPYPQQDIHLFKESAA
jgi:small conductance mechanosensitive channel